MKKNILIETENCSLTEKDGVIICYPQGYPFPYQDAGDLERIGKNGITFLSISKGAESRIIFNLELYCLIYEGDKDAKYQLIAGKGVLINDSNGEQLLSRRGSPLADL